MNSLRQLSPLSPRPVSTATRPAPGPAVQDAPPPPPADRVEFQADRPLRKSKAWLGAAALGAMSVAVLLSGCGTQVSPSQLGATLPRQTPQQDAQQALKFEIIPNAAGKIDIIRQTHTETSTDSEGNTTTETVDDPLQPVGVYLGNGLFLDAGLNLSLVPARVQNGPILPQDFSRAEIQGQLGAWSRSTITQNENQVTISSPLSFSHTITRDSEDQTTLQLGTFGAFQKFNRIVITRNGDSTTIQGWAPRGFEAMSRIEITQDGNTTTVRPFGIRGLVTTDIIREGNEVRVQPFGGALSRTEIKFDETGGATVSRPFGLTSQKIQRGEQGLSQTHRGLGSTYSSILQEGDGYRVREPGLMSTTTIRLQP